MTAVLCLFCLFALAVPAGCICFDKPNRDCSDTTCRSCGGRQDALKCCSIVSVFRSSSGGDYNATCCHFDCCWDESTTPAPDVDNGCWGTETMGPCIIVVIIVGVVAFIALLLFILLTSREKDIAIHACTACLLCPCIWILSCVEALEDCWRRFAKEPQIAEDPQPNPEWLGVAESNEGSGVDKVMSNRTM